MGMTARDVLKAIRDDLAQNGWHREHRSVQSALFRSRRTLPQEGWAAAVHSAADYLFWYFGGEPIKTWNDRQTNATEVLKTIDGAILLLGGP